MSRQIIFRPEADDDAREAAERCERKQPGLGKKFSRTLRWALRNFPTNPLSARLRDLKLGLRWYYLPRFPYRVVYRVDGDCILVVAILYSASHERQWRNRAKTPTT